ncbi:hypothetical protein [Paenibacillus sp. NPDC058177]|uniref:hypothetical protein n=1 Tax=Paenibacillus sp. NPDC058177 TaxID=3346369 RepID=UPI0036DAA3E4
MRKLILTMIILISLVGCDYTKSEPATTEKNSPTSEAHFDERLSNTNGSIESINDGNDKRFSYLRQLSLAKQESFVKFIAEEKNFHYLYDFTPEDMVLVYLYSLSVGDPDLIYAITYNAGLLPDQETFRNEYFKYASNYDSEIAVHYRYYESLKIEENTAEENKVTVIITAGVGIMTNSLALGLRKEDKIWKMDIYHLINQYKEKTSEVSE